MATYGRGFTLADADDNGIDAPATGGNPPGPWTLESGFYAYYEVGFLRIQGRQIHKNMMMSSLFSCVRWKWDESKAAYTLQTFWLRGRTLPDSTFERTNLLPVRRP